VGELTIIWPDADLEKLDAARGRLEVARSRLLARSDAELQGALGRVLDLWRDPLSRVREQLLDRHPEAAGMSRQTVAAGLELGLSDWSGDALRRLVAGEVEPMLCGGGARLVPFELTSVLLAGSIPMPGLLQCIAPLLLRSPVLVRPASRDRVTPALVAESITSVDPELGRCVEVVSFESDDRPCLESFLSADCVVASGSDETISEVRGAMRPHQRFVGYGHRLSVAVVGEADCAGPGLDATAEALSYDVAHWDQLGCLSPVAIFAVSEDEDAGRRLAGALARALERRERAMPRGTVDKHGAALATNERGEAELRAAAGRSVAVHADEAGRWTVVCEDDATWRAAPLHRFVRVHPVPDCDALARALQPIQRHLAAVALSGLDVAAARELSERLLGLGASRVCRPGTMQGPPLDWPHDGLPVLAPLLRLGRVE